MVVIEELEKNILQYAAKMLSMAEIQFKSGGIYFCFEKSNKKFDVLNPSFLLRREDVEYQINKEEDAIEIDNMLCLIMYPVNLHFGIKIDIMGTIDFDGYNGDNITSASRICEVIKALLNHKI